MERLPLQHAFGTIEIVRKYLISPCTIAIISGDLELYDDVIWRDFHGRLCDRSYAESDLAVLRAKKLSGEYQRKILPLPRRIEVPRLVAYLNDETVTLSDGGKSVISFPLFQLWLEAVLNERINGAENSFLFLPIDTVREFAQLVSHLYPLLSTLGKTIDGELDRFRLRRRIFMREEIANAIEAFAKNYASTRGQSAKSAREKDRKAAYDTLQARVKPATPGVAPPFAKLAIEWQDLLLTYFQHHERGGPIFLALKANQHFRKCMNNPAERTASVFDTDLFSPRAHEKYYQFSQSEEIKDEWQNHLSERIPNGFFKNLPKSSILPYPRPELGRRITDSGKAIAESETLKGDDVEDAELVRRLMTHYNFYTSSSRTTLTLTGRILELLVTSLIRDVSVDGVLDLIDRPPFHSATAIASTKTFDFDGEDEPGIDGGDEDVAVGDTLSDWIEKINAWRKANLAELESVPNAWLIYNVVNKYFNQVNFFNQADEPTPHFVAGSTNKRVNPEGTRLDVFGTALQAYRAIWAIFGSFEKGQVFGFDEVIAYRNIGKADARFEQNQLYLQNIKPFLQRDAAATGEKPYFNFQTGAYTYLLASHPLKTKLEQVYRNMMIEAGDAPAKARTSSVETKRGGEQLTYEKANSILNPLIRQYSLKANQIEQMDLPACLKIFDEIKHELEALGAEDAIQIARDMEKKSGGSALSKLHRLLTQIKILQDLGAGEASA
ncbi:hypothetical protein F2P45_33460 [Massilia sp. CCM 8733]|uniref:Uncharacterized protein n=1 Tax=Massilia mucilaginosa TaxID=2609282 RepID=A0ABX0P527_9BURK|nr:hypothetical protein [Massilia mucilaginosa]NHZ93870.1 hypothetical protein [Massilia mucilaginosa]